MTGKDHLKGCIKFKNVNIAPERRYLLSETKITLYSYNKERYINKNSSKHICSQT